MGISSIMVVVDIDCSTSPIRSTIEADGITFIFLTSEVWTTHFLLGLGTVGWEVV